MGVTAKVVSRGGGTRARSKDSDMDARASRLQASGSPSNGTRLGPWLRLHSSPPSWTRLLKGHGSVRPLASQLSFYLHFHPFSLFVLLVPLISILLFFYRLFLVVKSKPIHAPSKSYFFAAVCYGFFRPTSLRPFPPPRISVGPRRSLPSLS